MLPPPLQAAISCSQPGGGPGRRVAVFTPANPSRAYQSDQEARPGTFSILMLDFALSLIREVTRTSASGRRREADGACILERRHSAVKNKEKEEKHDAQRKHHFLDRDESRAQPWWRLGPRHQQPCSWSARSKKR